MWLIRDDTKILIDFQKEGVFKWIILNKMHFAAYGHTAAEVVYLRAKQIKTLWE